MIYRRLDSNGDYIIGGGVNEFLSGVEAVAQAIITRIKLLKEEWWENLDEGTPLWQSILGQVAGDKAKKTIDTILLKRIQNTKGVNSLESYDSTFDPQTRNYSFSAVVNTDYGTTTVSEVL